MKILPKAALIAFGVLGLAATNASAAVVCNEEGDCWHVRGRAEYKPEFRLQVHPDSWKWGHKDHYKWHEHDGHGYWRGGIWIGL